MLEEVGLNVDAHHIKKRLRRFYTFVEIAPGPDGNWNLHLRHQKHEWGFTFTLAQWTTLCAWMAVQPHCFWSSRNQNLPESELFPPDYRDRHKTLDIGLWNVTSTAGLPPDDGRTYEQVMFEEAGPQVDKAWSVYVGELVQAKKDIGQEKIAEALKHDSFGKKLLNALKSPGDKNVPPWEKPPPVSAQSLLQKEIDLYEKQALKINAGPTKQYVDQLLNEVHKFKKDPLHIPVVPAPFQGIDWASVDDLVEKQAKEIQLIEDQKILEHVQFVQKHVADTMKTSLVGVPAGSLVGKGMASISDSLAGALAGVKIDKPVIDRATLIGKAIEKAVPMDVVNAEVLAAIDALKKAVESSIKKTTEEKAIEHLRYVDVS